VAGIVLFSLVVISFSFCCAFLSLLSSPLLSCLLARPGLGSMKNDRQKKLIDGDESLGRGRRPGGWREII
jgi:hypothetical protein